MLRKNLPVGLMLICATLVGACGRADTPASPPVDGGVPHFQGMSNSAIESAVTRVRNRYLGMSGDLLAQLNQPGLTNRAEAAITHLLGRLRAEDAVSALLRRITFISVINDLGNGIVTAYSWGHHPAVNALISIGPPSVRAILTMLPQETNPLRRRLMVKVLVGVEGRAVTRFRLRRAIAKAANASEGANLTAALAYILASAH